VRMNEEFATEEELLKRPFSEEDVEWRVQSAGQGQNGPWAKVLTYITSRAIQDRMDEVFGIDGWWDEYSAGPSGGVLCTLSARFGDRVVSKQGIAGNTDIEAVKGGESGALKRAAVKFGIGRYLYNLHEGWAIIDQNGKFRQSGKGGKYPPFRWNPPKLPDWALPGKVFNGPDAQMTSSWKSLIEKAPADIRPGWQARWDKGKSVEDLRAIYVDLSKIVNTKTDSNKKDGK